MNWPQIITELLRLRHPDGRMVWNCASIARHCGCTRARIGQLRQPGTEPSWHVGERLRQLHAANVKHI